MYANLPDMVGIPRLKLIARINDFEQQLSWQGANPKKLPFGELRDHVRAPNSEDGIENKYQGRIKNRATAIRAYCVQCQGGYTAGVKDCASITCPLHPFRMGSDPLRGYALPRVELPELEDNFDGEFDEGTDGDDTDDKEAV